MKKLKKIGILFLLLIGISCEKEPNSSIVLQFDKMEIHYTKFSGWSQPCYLDVWGTGISSIHSQPNSTVADCTFWLTDDEKNKLVVIFSSFSDYDAYYEPDVFWTDQSTHRIVFIYEQKADTVSVYDPKRAKLPPGLKLILEELDNMVQQHWQ